MDIDFQIKLFTEHDYDCLAHFNCGVEDLDNFFHNEIKDCIAHNFIACYFALTPDGTIIAAFTLMNDAVMITGSTEKEDFIDDLSYISTPEKINFFIRQTSFPAINIGHLGISSEYQGRGIGTAIIDFVAQTFATYRQAGCQFITVDAINNPAVTNFYCTNGFYFQTNRDFYSSTRRMYRILSGEK